MNEADWIGREASRTVRVTAELVETFASLSGDTSPIHMSDEAGRAAGFDGRIVHGMLIGALISGVVGTRLPGARGVLQNVALSFRHPCRIGDEITIRVRVDEFHESVSTLVLKVVVERQDRLVLLTGTVRSGIR